MSDPRLFDGIPFDDMVLRRGGLGYKLSVWDGDARLFITDRVDDNLVDTPSEGQGMGVMLQLGPLWLRQFGELDGVFAPNTLKRNVEGQLQLFGISNPDDFPLRLNRLDIALDLLGLSVAGLSIDDWQRQWVGYARPKALHFASRTGTIEGLSVGSSQGNVRFKVYDKVAESLKVGKSGFWRSVWGLAENQEAPVARFEWSVRCYHARFAQLRYLPELTFERFLALLNYLTLKWGQLRLPQPGEAHKDRWPLAPLWAELVQLVNEWGFGSDQVTRRVYEFDPDVKETYLRFVTGTLAGLQVRVGYDRGKDEPASLAQALSFLHGEGHTIADIQRKADRKWAVFSRLARRSEQ